MRSLELYNRVVGSVDQAAIPVFFACGAAAIVIAALLYLIRWVRPLAFALGILGVLSLMFGLVVIHEAKVLDRSDEYVTVRHWRFPETVRFKARVALLCLPTTAAFVMLQLLWREQRQRRRALPNHLKEGRMRMAHGDYDAAMSSYTEVLKIAPYLGDAYLQRGCAQEAKGDCQAALVDYDRALRNDPQLAGAYLHRGRVRTELGELDAAEEDFNHFMSMRPNDIDGFLYRGICLAKKGDTTNAITDFHRVLKLTNHSDYADPARSYLAELEPDGATAAPAVAAPTQPNGAPPHPVLETTPQPDVEPEPS